jgi:uncharacterized protein (DUF1330 family)
VTAYLISEVVVLDQGAWQRYGELAAPAIAKYGGTYLVRRAKPEVAEGDWAPPNADRHEVIVAEFPSLDLLHAWYRSPEYAEALAYRKTAVRRRLLFVRGVDEPDG